MTTELGVKIHIILDQTFQSKRSSGEEAHEIPAHLVGHLAEFWIKLKLTELTSPSSPRSSSRRFDPSRHPKQSQISLISMVMHAARCFSDVNELISLAPWSRSLTSHCLQRRWRRQPKRKFLTRRSRFMREATCVGQSVF